MNFVTNSLIQRLPPINVHVWGGFGSQLFAAIVAKRLKNCFPMRKIRIVFHSSGVTSRKIEIPSMLFQNFEIIFCDDFVVEQLTIKKRSNTSMAKVYINSFMRSLMIEGLEKLKLLVRLNNESDFGALRPWLLEVRGHYTKIHLTSHEINWLKQNIIADDCVNELGNEVSIHFRLGDLLTLQMKSHISTKAIAGVISKIQNHSCVAIFSDSPPCVVKKVMYNSGFLSQSEILNLPTIEVIRSCTLSPYFIGTNSKISLWIAIFRKFERQGDTTWLPEGGVKQLEELLANFPLLPNVNAYRTDA